LFVPEGSLPQPAIKSLARKAGVTKAPFVSYPNKFEVGLPSVHYIWRSKALASASFEQLAYSIRFLESYLSRNVRSQFHFNEIDKAQIDNFPFPLHKTGYEYI
jgi:hypothetical protein